MVYFLLLFSCVGEDLINDYIEPNLRILNPIISINEGSQYQFKARFFDESGTKVDDPDLIWQIHPPALATIAQDGTFKALAEGQAVVSVQTTGLQGDLIKTTISFNITAAPKTEISDTNTNTTGTVSSTTDTTTSTTNTATATTDTATSTSDTTTSTTGSASTSTTTTSTTTTETTTSTSDTASSTSNSATSTTDTTSTTTETTSSTTDDTSGEVASFLPHSFTRERLSQLRVMSLKEVFVMNTMAHRSPST